jgi:hypothetical protein
MYEHFSLPLTLLIKEPDLNLCDLPVNMIINMCATTPVLPGDLRPIIMNKQAYNER